METKLVVFNGKKYGECYTIMSGGFQVIDVIEAITDSDRPRKYWSDLKSKLTSEGFIEVSEKNRGQLTMTSPDGKMRMSDLPEY